DRENVGMVQGGGSARFLFEAAQAVGVARVRGRKHLDGHATSEPRIPGPIHLAHGPRSDRSDDFVSAETGAGRQSHALSEYTPWVAGPDLNDATPSATLLKP